MIGPGTADSPGRGRRLLHLGLFALGLLAVGFWLAYVWLGRDDPQTWQRDWFCFYSAGGAFLGEGARGVYLEQCIENYVGLYPPYMLYPYALASLLPPLVFYGLAVVEILVLTALSLWLLRRALPEHPSFETIALVVAGSAALFATVANGQHSAILLAGMAGGLWAMRNGRPYLAGALLGLLGLKPNWTIVFVAWLIVTRRWRVLAGMAAVGIVMIAATLPMGIGVWEEYLTAGPRHIGILLANGEGGLSYPAHKLVTFEAFARSTFGALSPAAGKVAWITLEGLAIAACLLVWLRARATEDQLAMTALVALAANLYVEFYDVLVLAVPAAVWWTTRERYPPPTWRVVGGAAGAIWAWHWIWAVGSPGPGWPSMVGGLLAVWIAADASRVLNVAA